MTRRGIPLLLLACWLGTPLTTARAQGQRTRFELFAQVGVSTFSSASKSGVLTLPPIPGFPPSLPFTRETSFSTTGRLFTGFRYYLNRRNAVEASYSYSPNDFRGRVRFPTSIVFTVVNIRVHNVAFNYVRYLSEHGRVRTFATGGLGFAVFAKNFDRPVKFTGNFGGGADIRLHRRLTFRAELRDFLHERLTFGDPTAPGGVTHNLVPSVGIVLKF